METSGDMPSERNQNLSEENFKKVIGDVEKLKDDIKAMRDAQKEILLGQQTIEDLLTAIEKKG